MWLQAEVVPTCRELGIGIVAYSPLGRGFFAGKHDMDKLADNDFRRSQPRFQQEAFKKVRWCPMQVQLYISMWWL